MGIYNGLKEVASFYENEAYKVLDIVTYWFLHSYYIDNFTEKAGITVNPEYTLFDVIRQVFNLSKRDMRS